MTPQEQAFWDYYQPIEDLAKKHDIPVYQIVNFREIFDYAYTMGKADGVNAMYAIATQDVSSKE